jgi:hypothetical protein
MKEDTILLFILITLSLFSLGIILTLVERIVEFLIKVHHLQALNLFSLIPDVKWGEALKYFGVKTEYLSTTENIPFFRKFKGLLKRLRWAKSGIYEWVPTEGTEFTLSMAQKI